MGLSLYRYSEEEDFFNYFQQRLPYYEKAISILYDAVIYNQENKSYGYSFWDRLKYIFSAKKTINYKDVLLLYKILKEFIEFIKSKNLDKNYRFLELARPCYNLYYDLFRKKMNTKEKKVVDKVEHFNQSPFFNFYTIEESLQLLDININTLN